MSKMSEEHKNKLRRNLEKARRAKKAKQEEEHRSGVQRPKKTRRPSNLDAMVREILNDESIIDEVVKDQPGYWDKLPVKNGGYILATAMMVKAMTGHTPSAEWIRKTGFGDKVTLESENGFFQKSEFTIKVLPPADDGIRSMDVIEGEVKEIDG